MRQAIDGGGPQARDRVPDSPHAERFAMSSPVRITYDPEGDILQKPRGQAWVFC
jgi:hypothetical protein